MRWLAVVVIVAAGCGAKPPPEAGPVENLERAKPRRIKRFSERARMPRPAIDLSSYLPDFHDDLRWPLSGMTHPALEPRFPIARELAIGVGWQELCARGVHKRVSSTQRELLSYLHGWCDVLKRDVDGACEHLVPLLGSVRLGLTPAVRQDLANILVDSGDADKAEHYLSKHDIRDVDVLDLLAANYAEIGKPEDAFQINRRVIDADARPTSTTTCRRLVKRIVLSNDADATQAVEAFARLVTQAKVVDPVCMRLYNKVACWQSPEQRCGPYFSDERISLHARALIHAYYSWPDTGKMETWWGVADAARNALPMPGAAELAIAAFDASLTADSICFGARAIAVNHTLEVIRDNPALASYRSDARLARMAKLCPEPTLPAAVPAATGSASTGSATTAPAAAPTSP